MMDQNVNTDDSSIRDVVTCMVSIRYTILLLSIVPLMGILIKGKKNEKTNDPIRNIRLNRKKGSLDSTIL